MIIDVVVNINFLWNMKIKVNKIPRAFVQKLGSFVSQIPSFKMINTRMYMLFFAALNLALVTEIR